MSTASAYRPGQEIPGTNYRVIRMLGEGGHAFVYLGQHTVLGDRRAAIKVLHDTFSNQADLARRMRAEANILAQLRHPNLVRVFDAGMTTDAAPRPYTVMEYLRGEPLSSSIAASPSGVSISWALQTAAQFVAGLTAAHKRGVVHRDIKPANIFICRQPNDTDLTKLIDFGVASIDRTHRVSGRLFLGTPRYAAPEQLAGQKPTSQTDFYSVGLVLFELVCGRGPFDDIKPAPGVAKYVHLARMHLTRSPPRPSSIRRDIPTELEALILRLLEKDPARRPRTSELLEGDLHGIANRLEAERSATLEDANRTEPTPLVNRMIAFSADTDSGPAPSDPLVHDTQSDPRPMGNQRTLRMAPLGPSESSDLRALLPPDPSPSRPPARPTVRMPEAPPHPSAPLASTQIPVSESVSARRSDTTLPGPPPVPRVAARMFALSSIADAAAPPKAAPPAASLLPMPAPPHTSFHPAPVEIFAEPSTAPSLVPPRRERDVRASGVRTWHLAAGATVLLLLITLWTTRQPRFAPAAPPPWLGAHAVQTALAVPEAFASPSGAAEDSSPLPSDSAAALQPAASESTPPLPRPAFSATPQRMRFRRPPTPPTDLPAIGFKTSFQ
jgi:eukaryotic-like serine/threonine-protein kinase